MIVQKAGTVSKSRPIQTGGDREREFGDAAVGVDAVVRQEAPPPPKGMGKLIDRSA